MQYAIGNESQEIPNYKSQILNEAQNKVEK